MQPFFTVVSPVHNVAPYLADFFASLENQRFGIENLDIVLVDDGSTDGSLALCTAFALKWPDNVRVVESENGGPGSARNLGIAEARGQWLSMPDADDFLDAAYYTEVAAFIEKNSCQVLSTSITVFDEASGTMRGSHPLQRKFRYGNRMVDLGIEADCIQMHAASAVFNLAVIREHSLRFDPRIRPTFEDGHFLANFVLRLEHPGIGLIATATYVYRRRAAGTSIMDTQRASIGRFTAVPKYGYLAVLTVASELHGRAPLWLQNMLLYNLVWILNADIAVRSGTGSLPPEVLIEFHGHLRSIRGYLADEAIERFAVLRMTNQVRFALLHGVAGRRARENVVQLTDQDLPRGLVQLRYLFTGERPVEVFYVDSTPTPAAYAKDRAVRFYDGVLAFERTVWIPLGSRMAVTLDGELASIGDPESPQLSVLESHVPLGRATAVLNARAEPLRHADESLRSRWYKRVRAWRRAVSRQSLRSRLELTILSIGLHSAATRRRFGSAWLMMDRAEFANDNAEHLYRHIRESHPDINAWFTLNRSSPDWKRLRRDGFRLVAYGSLRWKLLVLSADHVASSHADRFVMAPPELAGFGPGRWRFTFLRHGVMTHDSSRWLRGKQIDLLVTCSPAEYSAVTADGSTYALTSKEARLTGLPRHDALRSKRDAVPDQQRTLLLVMPTWRSDLRAKPGEAEDVVRTRFAASGYAAAIHGLLASESLKKTAADAGLQIVFMPHPNVVESLDAFDVPAHVMVRRYDESDVQHQLARAAAVITDYSSLAYEAAVAEAPVVYYQFDNAEIFAGTHSFRKGHFDYEADGFGPVFTTLAEVEQWITGIAPGQRPEAEFTRRMRAAFAFHDTGSRARVVAAMRELNEGWLPSTDG